MSKNKSQPYIFVTQQKLIDFCRYDIGWFDLVGGSEDDAYPTNGFDVQCEVDYPMQLEDLRIALSHFADDEVPLDDFLFDWWYPVVVYFFHNLNKNAVCDKKLSLILEKINKKPKTNRNFLA